jgi:hypothetical protein
VKEASIAELMRGADPVSDPLLPPDGEGDMGPPEDFMDLSAVAFPDMDEERRMALYEAIKACR